MKLNYWIFIPFLAVIGCQSSTQKSEEIERPIPSVLEVVGVDKQMIDSLISALPNEGNYPETFSWKDHTVLFGVGALQYVSDIKRAFPKSGIKKYEKPFYIFDRKIHCEEGYASNWKHYVLTANLVEDPELQQEYMDYHETQFEEWPEVARGFCNAEFQQLLLYREGRQLMLIISIPDGKTLDELNPRTVENNPRVDDWNTMMGKYQEGIEGTEPGEVWVFLE